MIKIILTNDEFAAPKKIISKMEGDKKDIHLTSNGHFELVADNRHALNTVFKAVSELLQIEGFDRNYEVNSAGQILENLIDKLNLLE